SIGISDLLFADKIQKDSVDDIIHILPNVFKSFDNEFKKYAVYFEIYNSKYAWKNRDSIGNLPEEKEPVRIRYRVYDKNQKIVTEDSTVREVNQFQTFSSIEIDKSKVSFGKYVLDVMVYGKNGVRATSKAIFDVRLSTFTAPSLSATAFDLDVAIKQMRHVGRNLNTDKILKGTQKEKSDFFENFWRAKDPTPGTERNEIMEEYFRRVDYANRYFTSGYREGWDTDRGMVFIILEAPDDIERHPFDNNDKPYEIWYYYQANLRLLFVDVNQIGDYELMNRQEFESYLYLRR
ncbi:MAG TPA: GWxTD domain-containing protein, partial [bacterium]|nr:GWxTD domain-containing protein [bacterium]